MNVHTFAVTILAALLAVLTLASSAWAEYAWVVWVTVAQADPHSKRQVLRSWEVIRGTDTRQDCENLAREYQSKAAKNAMFSCLPDPVDPRVAKAR